VLAGNQGVPLIAVLVAPCEPGAGGHQRDRARGSRQLILWPLVPPLGGPDEPAQDGDIARSGQDGAVTCRELMADVDLCSVRQSGQRIRADPGPRS
jgi:hypothetical protein